MFLFFKSASDRDRTSRSVCDFPERPAHCRLPMGKGMEKRDEFVFLSSNLFGLLSLASRVFDNNGPAGISTQAGRPPVESAVTLVRAADSAFPAGRTAKFIYLVNRTAVRWILFLPAREKERERQRTKRLGPKGVSVFRFAARPLRLPRFAFRPSGQPFVSLLVRYLRIEDAADLGISRAARYFE